MDEESFYQVQKGLYMAFRDPVHKKRIDYFKANGLYVNKDGYLGINASTHSRPSLVKRLSSKIFNVR